MGICSSCYFATTGTITSPSTVKLILLEGELREFPSPMKVFLVAPPLDLGNDLCSFICNADEMDFDHYLTAMNGEEYLRLGQLYFELPLSWLNRRLAAEDMASLAVKAGRAITVSSGKVRCGCCVIQVDPVVFSDADNEIDVIMPESPSEMITSSWSRVGGGGGGGGNHSHGGKRRMFTKLERIAEE
ncbi:uncharacterized protein LOC112506295 [Cynara cardunculus var. scolymus]|uniref:uncharacterized protein LOC112506295 n=1 Tax=Cynara cardunculus var. scolymus TaxID=59895 RepID=UPI000D626125|nr:uncharacterized protein LOC112506295 [Cynara cardunculus var. scolymus]